MCEAWITRPEAGQILAIFIITICGTRDGRPGHRGRDLLAQQRLAQNASDATSRRRRDHHQENLLGQHPATATTSWQP